MKVSAVVALFMATSTHGQYMPAIPPSSITVPPPGSTGIDAAYRGAEANVPSSVSVGGATVNVDQGAIRDMMETDRKLWRADRGALFKIANTAVEEPLQRTGIRMAASVSRIFGPASEVLQGMVRGSASATTCQVPQYVDCVMKLP